MPVKRSGLGRNLSALLQQSVPVASNNTGSFTHVKITTLQPGQYQPRRAMAEAALLELAASIRQQGLLQPLVVRALAPDNYEIIAGERRYQACLRIGLETIPVIIREVDNETAMALALIENIQRESLNVIDCAYAMERLTREFGLTHQQIAEILSLSRASVSNHLRLLQLNAEVRIMLEQGALDMGHARCLLTLNDPLQVAIATQIVAKKLSVRKAEELVTRAKAERPIPPEKPILPLWINESLQDLQQKLRTSVKLKPGNDARGSLVIHYENAQALEQLMSRLMHVATVS